MHSKGIDMSKVGQSSKLAYWYWGTFFYNKIHSPIGLFWYRVKLCYKWIKNVLWDNVYEFESHGCFTLMRFQLELVQKSIINGYHTDQEHEIKELKLAIRLLKRLEADNYSSFLYKKLKTCYGFEPDWKIPFKNRQTKHDKAYTKAWRECMDASDAMRARDLKTFHNLFAKYQQKWWS